MPFRFRLQTLLRFRQSQEQQQEIRLREAHHQVLVAQQAISEANRLLAEMSGRRAEEMHGGVSGAELHFADLCRTAVLRYRDGLEHELEQREQRREEQRLKFHAARRERELVDALRERQFLTFQTQQKRDEQNRLDDLFHTCRPVRHA